MDAWRVSDQLQTQLPEVISKIVVRTVAGEVTVTSGDVPAFDIKRDSGADVVVELNDGTLFVSQPDPDTAPIHRFFKLLTEGTRHRCRVTITAPPSAEVQVTTVSADVIVSGFSGGTKAKTVSGDVTLNDLQTDVVVSTVSGDIEAKGIAAGLKVKTVSGDAVVVDGACASVDAKAVSGDVVLDLDLDPSGTYDITTVSGDVAVRTTSDPNLRVEATSVSGSLVTDFGIHWDARPGSRRVSETIGNGGARLWVKTVSGDLRVLRGRAVA